MNRPEFLGTIAERVPRLAAGVALTREVVSILEEKQLTFFAAGVAFYAFVSLLPAILLVLALSTTIFGEQVATAILGFINEFLTPGGQTAVSDAIVGASGRIGATVVGAVGLLWSALKVFRGLDIAFMQVYGFDSQITFVGQVRDAFVVAVSLIAGVFLMVVVGIAIATVPLGPFLEIAAIFTLPVALTVVFFPLYYLLPRQPVTARGVFPGTLFAAIGWSILQYVFQLYAGIAGLYQIYGLIGGVLLLVTWLYIGAVILLVGATINAVRA